MMKGTEMNIDEMTPFEWLEHDSPNLSAELIRACGSREVAELRFKEIHDEAHAIGVARERARCLEIVDMGRASGDMALALEAVKNKRRPEDVRDEFLASAGIAKSPMRMALTVAVINRWSR